MLQNAYLLAKIGADTAEKEQHFAENLPKIGNRAAPPARGAPAANDGVMTWDELLKHMDDLGAKWSDAIKGYAQ